MGWVAVLNTVFLSLSANVRDGVEIFMVYVSVVIYKKTFFGKLVPIHVGNLSFENLTEAQTYAWNMCRKKEEEQSFWSRSLFGDRQCTHSLSSMFNVAD
jgi:hypothetical protein